MIFINVLENSSYRHLTVFNEAEEVGKTEVTKLSQNNFFCLYSVHARD